MGKNKVKLVIGGVSYYISTDDEAVYVKEIADEVDKKMERVQKDNPRLSITMSAVLCALEYCDAYKKAEISADNLRGQIKEYLEDSARARMEVDVAHREIERLNKEIQSLRVKLANAGNSSQGKPNVR